MIMKTAKSAGTTLVSAFCFIGALALPATGNGGVYDEETKTWTIPSAYDEETATWIGDTVALTNAIKNVKANDVITLSKGVYDVSFLKDSPLYSGGNYGVALLSTGGKDGVTIRGATGNPEDVVLDGKGLCRVMSVNNETSKVRDLTINGGYVAGDIAAYNYRTGGGVLFASAGSVSNCIFSSCYASRGGGAVSGPFNTKRGYVYDCRFYGNTSGTAGGAIRCCTLVSGCTVVSNNATGGSGWGGGGLANCTTVSGCTVAYNCSSGVGGGLYNCTTVEDSTITHNVATRNPSNTEKDAGGAYGGEYYRCTFKDNCSASVIAATYMEDCVVEDGRVYCLTNINCVFRNLSNYDGRVWAKGNVNYPDGRSVSSQFAFHNVRLMRGCVITNCTWNYGSGDLVNCAFFNNLYGTVENCTITDNAVYYFGRDINDGAVFMNCAIVGNTSSDGTTVCDISMFDSTKYCFSNCVWNAVGRMVNASRAAPYVDGNCIVLGADGKPKFVGKGELMLTPRLSSPLIGVGMVRDWMSDAVDLAGNPRLRNGKVDVGAYQCWLDPVGMMFIVR